MTPWIAFRLRAALLRWWRRNIVDDDPWRGTVWIVRDIDGTPSAERTRWSTVEELTR